jgi:hypothetical protein
MRSIACSSFLGQMLISHFYATRLVLQGEGRPQSRQGEVNPVWMLRFVQHDKSALIPHAFCHPEHLFVIPSGSEESSMDASLRYALPLPFVTPCLQPHKAWRKKHSRLTGKFTLTHHRADFKA